jgi:hypothetical protein
LAHHQYFLELWALTNRSTSLDPISKHKNKCALPYSPHFQFIYMRVVLLRALLMRQIWATIGNIFRKNLRNFGNLLRITGEHNENTLGTRKRYPQRNPFVQHGPKQRSRSSHPLVSLPWQIQH